MKYLFFALFTVALFSAQEVNAQQSNNYIEVIDFHSNHRCFTCNTIEEKTKQTLEQNFKSEMDKGLITFSTINVDESKNAEKAEAFEAFGTALFIHIVKDGKSEKINLTDFAFMTAKDKTNKFEDGLTEKINAALAKL